MTEEMKPEAEASSESGQVSGLSLLQVSAVVVLTALLCACASAEGLFVQMQQDLAVKARTRQYTEALSLADTGQDLALLFEDHRFGSLVGILTHLWSGCSSADHPSKSTHARIGKSLGAESGVRCASVCERV